METMAHIPSHVGSVGRTRRLEVRLTAAELDELRARAKEAKARPSVYVRACVLGRVPRVIPSIDEDIARELARIGNNLNQIARRLNEHAGDDPSAEELEKAYTQLAMVVRRTYRELRP
jgi:hypothetical protein